MSAEITIQYCFVASTTPREKIYYTNVPKTWQWTSSTQTATTAAENPEIADTFTGNPAAYKAMIDYLYAQFHKLMRAGVIQYWQVA